MADGDGVITTDVPSFIPASGIAVLGVAHRQDGGSFLTLRRESAVGRRRAAAYARERPLR